MMVVANSCSEGGDGDDDSDNGSGYNYNDRGGRCNNDSQQWLTVVVPTHCGCDSRGGWRWWWL